jgi:hypothetical protein
MRRMLETLETVKRRRAIIVLIGFVVVIGALVRFHDLGTRSLWGDEAGSWTQAKDGLADLIKRTAEDNITPLHNLALFVTIKLFGDSEWSLRLPSAIFGVANIAALYWLSTMTFGRTAGLIGAILLALSVFDIQYSQEARMYSLLALSATLYAATGFNYLREPSLPRGAWVSLTGLALVYSHPYGTLYWIAMAAAFTVLYFPPPRIMFWAISNIAVVAGFAPWAAILVRRAQVIAAQGFWIPPLNASSLVSGLLTIMGESRLYTGVILIGVVLGIIGRLRRDVATLCVWIIVPVAIAIVTSYLWRPILIPRYVIGSLPPLLLLSAFGWAKYAKDWRGAILSTAVVAVAVLNLFRYERHARDYLTGDYVTGDWRSVAIFLDTHEQSTDCVLVPSYITRALNYYRRNPSCRWEAVTMADLPADMPASRLFVAFYTPVSTKPDLQKAIEVIRRPQNAIEVELRRRGWRSVDRVNFHGARVIIYSHPQP